MDLGLANKHVFIAGASRGIGLSIAEAFLDEGARVSLAARGVDSLEHTYAALAARYGKDRLFRYAGDMTLTGPIGEALDQAEAALGPLHCVVGNVGIDKTPAGWNVDDETFDIGFAQNFLSSYRLAREAVKRVLPRKPEHRDGFNIVFITSGAGINAFTTPLTYGSSKAMVNHVTKEMGKLLGKDGIRVNAVSPGPTLFPGGTWEKLLSANPEHWTNYIKQGVPLGRFGKPEEAANVVAFVASPRASFVNATIVVADGGQVR